MKKRFLSVLLLMSLIATSCGGGAADPAETSGGTDSVSSDETTGKAGSGLDPVDYGGEEIVFYTYKTNEYMNSQMDVLAEEANGEAVNDAVWERNRKLEDKYKVTISSVGELEINEAMAQIKNTVLAGDDSYDVCMLASKQAMSCGLEGLFVDMNTVGHIDVSKAWWNGELIGETSILGANYFYIGDMNLDTWTQSYVTYFNKKLAEEYGIPDLYSLVKSGGWTFDKLDELSRSVYSDLNGNGKYDENDLYGLTACSIAIECFFASSAVKMVEKDRDGKLSLGFGEDFVGIWEKISSLIDAPEMLYTDRPEYTANRAVFDRGAFKADRALFFIEGLCVAQTELRSMESDYGIIPLPKRDERQESYSVYSHTSNNSSVSIPMTSAGKLDMLGRIIEDMAYFSSDTVRPAYYKMMLEGKLARSDEDVEMLDIITKSVFCDLGFMLFNTWELRSGVMNDQAASYIDSHKNTYQAAIDDAMSAVEENAK